MNVITRVISASLSPNTETDDVQRAILMLVTPWRWKTGKAEEDVVQWFSQHFNGSKAVLFNSGRSALFAILQSFGIGSGDEVIVQAFTCVAVPNSVLWTGAIPVYADTDATYNIDPSDFEGKITPRTKAVIVQHTFGVPADMQRIVAIAKKHHVLVIEDCAHALGSSWKGIPLGSIGDAAFFSFGRDKPVSSVWGGAAIIHSSYKEEAAHLCSIQASLPKPGLWWIAQQIMHPIAFSVILPLYNSGFGKLLLVVLQKITLLSLPVFPEEKQGGHPNIFPSQYPNGLANLLMGQLKKLDRYTMIRKDTAAVYAKAFMGLKTVQAPIVHPGASYLRYTMSVRDPQAIRRKAKANGMLLGNWYNNIIDPTGVSFAAIGYTKGSCKNAERQAETAINLPTLIGRSDAQKIISFFRSLH